MKREEEETLYGAKNTDDDAEQVMRKRLKQLKEGKFRVAATNVAKGTTDNANILLTDVQILGGNSKYIRITGVLLGVDAKPELPCFHIPTGRPTTVAKAMLDQWAPQNGVLPRLPLEVPKGEVLTMVCFDNTTENIQIPSYATISGLVYEVAHKQVQQKDGATYIDPTACLDGDAYLDLRFSGLTITGQPKFEELRETLKIAPFDRIENLKHGQRVPYPENQSRVTCLHVGKKKETRANLVDHWMIPTEELAQRGEEKPIVFFHLSNPFWYYLRQEDTAANTLSPFYLQNGGLTMVTSESITSTDFLKVGKDGQEKIGVSGEPDANGNKYLVLGGIQRPFNLFSQIRDEARKECGTGGVMDLGVSTTQIWLRVGQQLMRTLDCIMSLTVDPQRSLCTSKDNEFNLVGQWAYAIIMVNLPITFGWAGLEINFELAQQILQLGRPKEESLLQKRLLINPDSVRVICLNEFKGDLSEFSSPKWRLYCVPPSDENPDLMYDIGAYIEWQNFMQINELGGGCEFVKKNWHGDNVMRKLSIFATRREA